jgi:hypothetical protein
MARRGTFGGRILAGLIGIGISVIAALMVLFGHHGKTNSAAPPPAQPQAAAHGP